MHSLGIVQWNSTRRDHLGNPGGVSGSGLVISSTCPLRNGSQKASTSKSKKTWVEKSKVTNHQGPKKIWVPKSS